MLIYPSETFIRAHADRSNLYYDHSYDRYVRDAVCSACHRTIGEQVKYPDFEKEFIFESVEKNYYKFCPYCGEKL